LILNRLPTFPTPEVDICDNANYVIHFRAESCFYSQHCFYLYLLSENKPDIHAYQVTETPVYEVSTEVKKDASDNEVPVNEVVKKPEQVPAVYAANQVVEVTTPDVEETKVSAMFPFEPGGKFNSANVETKEMSDEFSDVTQPLFIKVLWKPLSIMI
jgi:hypothetical protein